MIDFAFLSETFFTVIKGVPLTLELAAISVFLGAFLAFGLALMRLSRIAVLDWSARAYVTVFQIGRASCRERVSPYV